MDQFFDPWLIVYTVIGLVPNLLLMLWALARLSRDVRLLSVKVSMIESEIRLIDQSMSQGRGVAPIGGAAPVPPRDEGKMEGGTW